MMSTSPLISACTAVFGVGNHQPLDAIDLGDLAAGEARRRLGRAAGSRDSCGRRPCCRATHSSRTNMNGPEPIAVVIAVFGSSCASASRVMNSGFSDRPASPAPSPNGLLKRISNVSGPVATISFANCIIVTPAGMRFAKRRIDATASFAVTGLAVVELEPGAQLERPGEAVGAPRVALDHLRLAARACCPARTACRRSCSRDCW